MDLLHFSFLVLLVSNAPFNNVEGLKAQKIVSGIAVRKGELRYTVAVMYKSSGERDHNPCAGAIVSDWFIVTVAHCFYDKIFGEWRTSLFYISVGVYNLDKPLPTTRNFNVDTITIPKLYNPDKPDNHATEGNFAMVKLDKQLGLTLHGTTIAKVIPRQQKFRKSNLHFFVTGFGYHEVNVVQKEIYGEMYDVQIGSTDRKLRYARAILLNHLDCHNIIKENIARGNMCAKILRNQTDKPAGLCRFDSGAPLVHRNYLGGIAINGLMECDEEQMPGSYIDVKEYHWFIKITLEGGRTNNMRVLKLKKDEYGEYMFEDI